LDEMPVVRMELGTAQIHRRRTMPAVPFCEHRLGKYGERQMTTTPMRERLARALCSEFDTLPDKATYMHRKSNPDKHWLDKGEVLADVDAMLSELERPSEAVARDIAEDMREAGHGPISHKAVIGAFNRVVAAIREGA
jgi:hypothetical protein